MDGIAESEQYDSLLENAPEGKIGASPETTGLAPANIKFAGS